MTGKKWIATWFLIISALIVIGSFNYYIDSLGLVHTSGYLDQAAKAISDNKIIGGLKNFDERIFRKKTIEYLKNEPSWVAIGSSRIMQLRQHHLGSDHLLFQNYSVSGATLEDYIALLQIHRDKFGTLPQNIIFGIDPWIFNENSGQNRYLSINPEYLNFLKNLNYNPKATVKQTGKYAKLFSLEYTIENIKFIQNNMNNGLKGFYISDSIDVDDYLREPDGSIQYPYKHRKPDFNKVKQLAIEYTKGNVYSLENFRKISNKELFEKFMQYLQDQKINIVFYLLPYNPISYDILVSKPRYQIINEVENYLVEYAKTHGIQISGSYNPHKYNLDNTDFFDGMHVLENVYTDILGNLDVKSH